MVSARKIDAKDYYDFYPLSNHRTGDIWCGLPTFGNLYTTVKEGLIITPACDLAARKSETVTYLPIISVEEYMNSPAFYAEIWIEINRHLTKHSGNVEIIPPNRYDLPPLQQIEEVAALPTLSIKSNLSIKAKFLSYISYIKAQHKKEIIKTSDIMSIFTTSKSDEIKHKIIQNAYKTDIHFLPRDEKDGEYSALRQHSVVLFRYAQSISSEAMDAAQNSTIENWSNVVEITKTKLPCISHFEKWPIKMMTLKDDFLSDLLSRYIGLYGRLGSRDFSGETVSKFAVEIGA